MKKDKQVIIALDFPDSETTLQFLSNFSNLNPYVKVGMQLFYSEGPEIIKKIKDMGFKVFLDLKLHDIPNTVKSAVKSLCQLNCEIINVHALGGSDMMKAAVSSIKEYGSDSKVIAVTQLTSTNSEMLKNELLIQTPMLETVVSYSKNAQNSGLDGVVCSPFEAKSVHEICGDNFITVTPGIRFPNDSKNDQKRVTTPSDARLLGSDMIVVGRTITASNDPVKSYLRCVNDFTI